MALFEDLWNLANQGQKIDPVVRRRYAALVAEETANWINRNVGMLTIEDRVGLAQHLGLDSEAEKAVR